MIIKVNIAGLEHKNWKLLNSGSCDTRYCMEFRHDKIETQIASICYEPLKFTKMVMGNNIWAAEFDVYIGAKFGTHEVGV